MEAGSSTTSESATQSPTKHSKFWYNDGSVVFHVGNALFRVHQSLLSAQSEVFADLFTLPQPPDAEQMDGCPLVVLPDAEVDFCAFLQAIYDPMP